MPKSVIKQITKICLSLFWKVSEETAKEARVSWASICLPKSERGLGVKDISSWNKACIMQNRWAIISKAESIWIAWINEYVLKGRSF